MKRDNRLARTFIRLVIAALLLPALGHLCGLETRAQQHDEEGPSTVEVPSALSVTATRITLITGETTQVTVTGTFAGGTTRNLTASETGTVYNSDDPSAASVSDEGLITALSGGQVTIEATHEGVRASVVLTVRDASDRDDDSLPNDYESANGLNPDDAADAAGDADADGLTNLDEYLKGTNPRSADSDGDGIRDGAEDEQGSNPLLAQPVLNENCTASIQNRTVQIGADGTFAIPNVPVDDGFYRVRVVCKQPDGTTKGGQSPFLQLTPADAPLNLDSITLGTVDPIPVSLAITLPQTTFRTKGETAQLTTTGTMPDGSTRDLTQRAEGTSYSSSNPLIATVGNDGLLTVVARGQAIITARNEGTITSATINVLIPNDADDDGMPDDFERANGLDLNDRSDSGQDPDLDGLTNLREFQLATNPRSADTDGDGLTDNGELARGTSPATADTDGDGLRDGQEIAININPLNPDTDGDGMADGLEMRLGLNPRTANPTTTVHGRVVDSAGAAVSGANAIVLNLLTATTDSTGYFNIERVPAGLGPVTVLAETIRAGQIYTGTSAPVAPTAGGTTDAGTIQIVLDSGAVSGVVTDLQNRRVVGAQVTVVSGPEVRPATTDATGRFRVANMNSGPIVVMVQDFTTGLRGRAAGSLSPNQSAVVDVRLAPSGSVAGTVYERDGTTEVGPGVSVNLSGQSAFAVATDVLGQYRLDFVNLGSFTVDAADTAGNRGRTTSNLTATSQTALADVTFLGRGAVSGLVKDGSSNPVPNATVSLNSRSIFGGSKSTVTDASGRYSLTDVFVGQFDVAGRAPITRLGGQTTGSVTRDGQSVTADITLIASGTLTGTVFRANGTTAVSGAEVRLAPTGLVATTDAQGRYRFEFIPTGTYNLQVTDLATGDRGQGGGTISAQDETRTVNVSLNGQGQVVVTVRDGAGNTAGGAQVTLTSRTSFGGTQTATAQADGTAVFARVLAGSFDVSAVDPSTQLRGTASGSVPVGATANVTVNLQSFGSITGAVLAPNGTTPVGNIRVRISGQVTRTLVNSANGRFNFEVVPVGQYNLEAIDSAGHVRARATARVGLQGEEASVNLILIGAGVVSGTITNPDGSVAGGVSVVLRSATPGFGVFSATSNVTGVYTISQVPVGEFDITASRRSGDQELFGSAEGAIVSDGESLTRDIQLSANLIPVTRTFYDANNLAYNLRENGSLQDGSTNVFAGDGADNRGASLLDLKVNGQTLRFSGRAYGTAELEGRQLVIRQEDLGGLNVTRKVFVPRAGFFARYLEIVENPTAAPVTVDVRVTSNYRFITKVQGGFTFDREPRLVSTTSGDTMLDISDPATRDRWAVVDDDEDLDPFTVSNLPPVAQVFDGAGAAQPAAVAQFSIDFAGRYGQLVNEWQSVEVPAGGSVAIMHFVSEQTSRSAAQASAERLTQLPPEALTGLSADDRARIKNFAVPADGVSTLAALPPLTGTVSGRVLGPDETTPIHSARVYYQSANPLFARTHQVGTDSQGNWSLTGRLNDNGSSIAVPVSDFNLRATDLQTQVESPVTPGSFPDGLLTATQNVVFSNSGIIQGVVRRANGVVASSGTVRISGGDLQSHVNVAIAGDGSYHSTGLAAGTYTLTVTIPHPQGSALTGGATASVFAGQTTTTDITVQPTGEVTGLVRRETGETAVNLTVHLRGGSNFLRTARTDTSGRFTFTDVPVGAFTLETFEQETNTAATALVNTLPEQSVTADLTLVRGGAVTGLVTNPSNQPVAGVQVTLTASNGTFNGVTGADGRYRFEQVSAGGVSVSATDAASGLRGRASGSLGLSGQVLTLDMRLFASGIVTGTIFEANGTTAVPGAQVTLRDTTFWGTVIGTATADAAGRYTIGLVPVGSFVIDVTHPTTGDRGRVSNQVNANNETRTINVSLNGLGRVVVTVRDGGGQLVGGARVTVSSQTQFGGSQQADTLADGTATFERVFAGNYNVSATDPATRLSGSTTGSVAAGATAATNLQLQPAGTIVGTVIMADGLTPLGGARVRLHNNNFFFSVVQETTSAGDGSYRFDAVPVGAYSLDVLDANNRVRARENGVTLSNNGEIATRNLVLVGQGTVSGRVTNPNASNAPNLTVTLRSSNAAIGGFFTAQTDAQGLYSISQVPVGGFTATATNSAQATQGEVTGRVSQDGEAVTADIRLANNSISLPTNRYDANNFFFDIQRNGSTEDGTFDVYSGDYSANRGAFLLDIVAAGTANRFTGGTLGTTEEGGREIAVRQQNLAGLNVIRKVFVPTDGYFTRYLEVLTNPTASPITVDVRVLSHYFTYYAYYYGVPHIDSTSTGDATLDVSDSANPDRWVVIDDNTDGDPALLSTPPAVSFAFDGPGAAERAGATSFGGTTGGQLTYEWKGVTVAPGQTVAYMHFGAQQTSRAAARASAERLTQLPPEALVGLSPEETAQIKNFAVPADGVSAVAPLPALNGTVTGFVLASDNAAGVPSTQVAFRSANPLFGRTFYVNSNASGVFTFTSRFNNSGSSLPIPIDSFTLNASHPQTGINAPTVTGAFGSGQTTAAQNVVFVNTGTVRGTLRRHTGTPVTSGFVVLNRNSPYLYTSVNVGSDGAFAITGVPAGTYTLTGYRSNGEGTDLSQATSVSVIVGQTTIADITLPPTGTVSGTVRNANGTLAPNVYVHLYGSGGSTYVDRAVYTNASGQYTFVDVPIRTLVVEAHEPNSGVPTSATITVVQDQTVTQDLTLVGLGQAQVQVNFLSGAPAPGAQVYMRIPSYVSYFNFYGYTDSGGRLTINNVPVGAFIIQAYNPNNTSLYAEVESTLGAAGQVVPVTVVLPGTGVVTGRVSHPNGTPSANSYVEVYGPNVPGHGAYTDSNGNYSITQVVVGRTFSVRAYTPNFEFSKASDGHILNTDGETATINVTLPALATVRVRVLRSDGTPYSGARIEIRDGGRSFFRSVGNTDAAGLLAISQVPEGDFFVRAFNASTGAPAGSASGTVRLADHGQTVEVTINAPLAGTVEGTVFAADGQTPLVSSYVQITDVATGQYLTAAYTNSQGLYRLTNVAAGNDGFSVTAYSPGDFSVTVSATGSIPNTGESVTINLTLPVSVITGVVRYADGTTPVPYPDVFATYRDANGNMRSTYSRDEREDGTYTVTGVPAGDFTLMAQDGWSGLTRTVTGSLADINTPLTINVTLPPSGTVTGTVRDASGAVVPYADVALASSGLAYENYSSADEQGVYTFEHIPIGTFTVQATNDNYTLFGVSGGTLTNDGEAVTVNVTLPQSGTVRGRVFLADGTTPVVNAWVYVENFNSSGPLGYHYERVRTDAGGNYELAGVQVGPVSVTAYDPNDFRSVGLSGGVVPAGAAVTVNVVLGSAVTLDYNLDGADGFRYDIDYDGSLSDGGTVDRTLTNAYNGAYYLTLHLGDVYGYDYFSPNNNVGLLEDAGRELLIGPSWSSMGGLSVRRKVFVPTEGGFARYLEVLSNPTNVPLTVTFQVETYFGNYRDIRLVVSPEETQGRYAVTDNEGECCNPALGHVFAGPGGATAPNFSYVTVGENSWGEMLTRYTVTVPAGETRILMHFAVQRGAADAAGARTQSEALVNLSDPAALQGMSAAEKAQVLNFNVPQN